MVDPGTAIAALGPAAVVVKILGPTADYVGDGVQQWTERRVANVHRIFENAEEKLGPEELEKPGSVPPRVLKGILDEGQFVDDELGAEYLGGVLASARTTAARDDRGASLVALVARLSTYQLRAHYIMYSVAQEALASEDLNLGEQAQRERYPLFLPFEGFTSAMDLTGEELADFSGILLHIVNGLLREGLIEDHFAYGGAASIRAQHGNRDFGSGGLVYRITTLGIELFCAAHGMRGEATGNFQSPPAEFSLDCEIPLEGDFGLVNDIPVIEHTPDAG
jgi:hypothetical protein